MFHFLWVSSEAATLFPHVTFFPDLYVYTAENAISYGKIFASFTNTAGKKNAHDCGWTAKALNVNKHNV